MQMSALKLETLSVSRGIKRSNYKHISKTTEKLLSVVLLHFTMVLGN